MPANINSIVINVFSAGMKLIQFVSVSMFFRVLLKHAATACLQGFSRWLVFSI